MVEAPTRGNEMKTNKRGTRIKTKKDILFEQTEKQQ